ncbi:hypothetical protein K8R03_02565 [Candidatus Kaiserbacteria bacterium]|nr:hypothetical protein [Candidatus Kaiserbacteria bacterium]
MVTKGDNAMSDTHHTDEPANTTPKRRHWLLHLLWVGTLCLVVGVAAAVTGVYFWKGTGLADTQAALASVTEQLSTAQAKLKTFTDAQEKITALTGERDKLKSEIAVEQGKVTKLSGELIALKAKQQAEAPAAKTDDKVAKTDTKPDAKADGTVEPKADAKPDVKVEPKDTTKADTKKADVKTEIAKAPAADGDVIAKAESIYGKN